jgi:hypothetical protein
MAEYRTMPLMSLCCIWILFHWKKVRATKSKLVVKNLKYYIARCLSMEICQRVSERRIGYVVFVLLSFRDRIPPFPLMRGQNYSFGHIPSIEQSKRDVFITVPVIYDIYQFSMVLLRNVKLCTSANCILVSIVNFTFLLCSMCSTRQQLVLLCRVFLMLIYAMGSGVAD